MCMCIHISEGSSDFLRHVSGLRDLHNQNQLEKMVRLHQPSSRTEPGDMPS